MKQLLCIFISVFLLIACNKQKSDQQTSNGNPNSSVPDMVWYKEFGGQRYDIIKSVIATSDSGYILAGCTDSYEGDVSVNYGKEDGWVVKLDKEGNIQWSKVFGGTQPDFFTSVIASADGGYLMAGYTSSNDGDINERHRWEDAWVVKIDKNGNKLWSRVFGSDSTDKANSIVNAIGGGYVVTGYTTGNNRDVSGNHGMSDGWVVKLDVNGNMVRQKAFGGSQKDTVNQITATTDGGYIITGCSDSKDGDINGTHGNADAWVMKLDADLNKKWSKVYGGSDKDVGYSITKSDDGGFVMAGVAGSSNGDIESNHGSNDGWVLKLDKNGNKLWSKCFGGALADQFTSVIPLKGGGFVLTGDEYSYNSGDIIEHKGGHDAWIVKIDKTGNKIWSKVFGDSSAEDIVYSGIPAMDGGFIMAGYNYLPFTWNGLVIKVK